MITATIFTRGQKPIDSGDLVLRGENDAREWCMHHAPHMGDVFAILRDGVVIYCGRILDEIGR